MRFLRVIPFLLTIALIWLLDHPIGTLPALGRLLDPVNGALAAAESVDEDFNKNLKLEALQAPVSIWLEDRLVPHVRAQNDHDLYYTQGYLHAYFRLWQMDMQTRAAGGRISEVAGPKAITFDRGQRRKGMSWGAGRSLEAMEHDPRTKTMLDAYRDGINAYIHSLDYRSLPIEYKLMGFYPEDWTNLRTSLMAKNLADDLTSKTDDIAYTLLRDQLGQAEFDFLFPEKIKGSKPVIPEGTPFAKPSLAIPKYPGDSVWAHFRETGAGGSEMSDVKGERRTKSDNAGKALSHQLQIANCKLRPKLPIGSPEQTPGEETAKGSNNWAISGAHTASGKPILCNDPHLSLNLPSLWFEMQLTAPGVNVYGASLPGAPGIVIGFNQRISWGFTNNYRDVKDFYAITADPLQSGTEVAADSLWIRPASYHFSGKLIPFERSVEVIKVKGAPDLIDTVLYTLHGPVNYDPSFKDLASSGKLLACTWMGHRGSNELLATYLLNRAVNYDAFTSAIHHFECPAQNIAYADGAGNIAIWGQGRYINKWKGQGKYVMEGRDSLTLWGESIPMAENPHVLNPPQGYVASANQSVTDSTYPYWYNGSFVEWRSWEINGMIGPSAGIYTSPDGIDFGRGDSRLDLSLDNMKSMQSNEWSLFAQNINGYLCKFSGESVCGNWLKMWNHFLSSDETGGTIFQILWSQLYRDIWQDDFSNPAGKYPSTERTVQLLLSDSTSKYYDDSNTEEVETLRDIVQRAFKETADSLDKLKASTSLEWYKVKNTTLKHLAKIPAFSYDHLKIGGWSNTINAVTGDHGPSWRMIVEMDSIPKAYAVYPGGQSGNPGSSHYGDFINHWVEGKYFTIQFLTAIITKNPFKYTWTLIP